MSVACPSLLGELVLGGHAGQVYPGSDSGEIIPDEVLVVYLGPAAEVHELQDTGLVANFCGFADAVDFPTANIDSAM
jgi:hypothetical protein